MGIKKPGVKGSKLPEMQPADCKSIRLALDLTQETFAEKVGVTTVTVARWEAGSTPIAKGRAMAIRALAQEKKPEAVAS